MTRRGFLPAIAAALLLITASAYARDPSVPRQFERLHPCPSTGRTTGACPGWVRDHVIPLCKGGADATWNMQWQTVADAKAKDHWECKR